MAIFKTDCPHCGLKAVGAKIYHIQKNKIFGPMKALVGDSYCLFGWLVSACGNCLKPISAEFQVETTRAENQGADFIKYVLSQENEIRLLNFRIEHTWPAGVIDNIPGHLDPMVEKAFRQGESNFHIQGNEEASGAMYRRSIEISFKNKFPLVRGNNNKDRIRNLAEAHLITQEMAHWADEVRLAGNDSMHEVDGISRSELEALRMFTYSFLQYAYTLPEEVRINREKRQNSSA